jgi:hypothetical protein
MIREAKGGAIVRRGTGRRYVTRAVKIALVGALFVVVPVGIVAHLRSHGPKVASAPVLDHHSGPTKLHRGTQRRGKSGKTKVVQVSPSVKALDGAIAKTLSVSNYDLTFSLSETGDSGASGGRTPAAQGYGVADLDPQALSASTTPGCVSAVSLRVDGSDVWDVYEASDPSGPPGEISGWTMSSLLGFQSSVDICLGNELGALATIGMCSPSGQLVVSAQAIATATPVGTVTVNGESAEEYQVGIDPAGFLEQPNSTEAENEALQGAVTEIGTNPMTATVDVDSAGYIVEMDLSVAYADGVTATHSIVLSNFDNAGTIGLPPVQATPPTMSGPPALPSGGVVTAPRPGYATSTAAAGGSSADEKLPALAG